MELKLDVEAFEKRQVIFIEEIMGMISLKLREGGIEGLQLEELTASIAFSIASIIDDTSYVESDGVVVKPYLAFKNDDDELVHCGENAYTYEYVIHLLKKMFDK